MCGGTYSLYLCVWRSAFYLSTLSFTPIHGHFVLGSVERVKTQQYSAACNVGWCRRITVKPQSRAPTATRCRAEALSYNQKSRLWINCVSSDDVATNYWHIEFRFTSQDVLSRLLSGHRHHRAERERNKPRAGNTPPCWDVAGVASCFTFLIKKNNTEIWHDEM